MHNCYILTHIYYIYYNIYACMISKTYITMCIIHTIHIVRYVLTGQLLIIYVYYAYECLMRIMPQFLHKVTVWCTLYSIHCIFCWKEIFGGIK